MSNFFNSPAGKQTIFVTCPLRTKAESATKRRLFGSWHFGAIAFNIWILVAIPKYLRFLYSICYLLHGIVSISVSP